MTTSAVTGSAQTRWIRRFDTTFAGAVTPWIYVVLRIGLATLLLLRESDFLRSVASLEHHVWVHGFDFDWSISTPPYLVSPLVPGLVLGPVATHVCVLLRMALAVALLLGIRPRTAALLCALASYVLMFADRYRYYHHLHLLFFSLGWSSLAPLDARWSLERALRRAFERLCGRTTARLPRVEACPIWPLQLIRALPVSVYVAAGTSKLCTEWLSGETLSVLDRLHALHGVAWTALHGALSYASLAWLACLTELALPVLLLVRSTRRIGVITAIAFHALISAVMPVSTFGLEMALLVLAFWPDRNELDVAGSA